MLNTYWNRKGAEQEKYDEMMDAGWDVDMMTKAAQNDMHRYYRYYNDGDIPGWARSRWDLKVWSPIYGTWRLNEKGEQELEDRATATVLAEYRRFQRANKN